MKLPDCKHKQIVNGAWYCKVIDEVCNDGAYGETCDQQFPVTFLTLKILNENKKEKSDEPRI